MKIRKGRFSGTIGLEVYVNSKHGQVVRSRPRRPWRPTPARLAVQHNLARVVNAWRQLTPKQYQAWAAAARKENMSTYPFFSKINGALEAAKLPLLMDPPKRVKLTPNPVGELEILNRGGVITLRLRVPRAPAHQVFVLGSRWCSRGIWTRGNRFTVIGALPARRGRLERHHRPLREGLRRAAGGSAGLHPHSAASQRLGRWIQGDLCRRAAAREARELRNFNRCNAGPTLGYRWSAPMVASKLQACCKPVAGLFEASLSPLPPGSQAGPRVRCPPSKRQGVPKRPDLRYRRRKGRRGYKDSTPSHPRPPATPDLPVARERDTFRT